MIVEKPDWAERLESVSFQAYAREAGSYPRDLPDFRGLYWGDFLKWLSGQLGLLAEIAGDGNTVDIVVLMKGGERRSVQFHTGENSFFPKIETVHGPGFMHKSAHGVIYTTALGGMVAGSASSVAGRGTSTYNTSEFVTTPGVNVEGAVTLSGPRMPSLRSVGPGRGLLDYVVSGAPDEAASSRWEEGVMGELVSDAELLLSRNISPSRRVDFPSRLSLQQLSLRSGETAPESSNVFVAVLYRTGAYVVYTLDQLYLLYPFQKTAAIASAAGGLVLSQIDGFLRSARIASVHIWSGAGLLPLLLREQFRTLSAYEQRAAGEVARGFTYLGHEARVSLFSVRDSFGRRVGEVRKGTGMVFNEAGEIIGHVVGEFGFAISKTGEFLGQVYTGAGRMRHDVIGGMSGIWETTVFDRAGKRLGSVVDSAGTVLDASGKIIGKVVDEAGTVLSNTGKFLGRLPGSAREKLGIFTLRDRIRVKSLELIPAQTEVDIRLSLPEFDVSLPEVDVSLPDLPKMPDVRVPDMPRVTLPDVPKPSLPAVDWTKVLPQKSMLTRVTDAAGKNIGNVIDAAGVVVDDAGNFLGQVNDAAGRVVDQFGRQIGEADYGFKVEISASGDVFLPQFPAGRDLSIDWNQDLLNNARRFRAAMEMPDVRFPKPELPAVDWSKIAPQKSTVTRVTNAAGEAIGNVVDAAGHVVDPGGNFVGQVNDVGGHVVDHFGRYLGETTHSFKLDISRDGEIRLPQLPVPDFKIDWNANLVSDAKHLLADHVRDDNELLLPAIPYKPPRFDRSLSTRGVDLPEEWHREEAHTLLLPGSTHSVEREYLKRGSLHQDAGAAAAFASDRVTSITDGKPGAVMYGIMNEERHLYWWAFSRKDGQFLSGVTDRDGLDRLVAQFGDELASGGFDLDGKFVHSNDVMTVHELANSTTTVHNKHTREARTLGSIRGVDGKAKGNATATSNREQFASSSLFCRSKTPWEFKSADKKLRYDSLGKPGRAGSIANTKMARDPTVVLYARNPSNIGPLVDARPTMQQAPVSQQVAQMISADIDAAKESLFRASMAVRQTRPDHIPSMADTLASNFSAFASRVRGMLAGPGWSLQGVRFEGVGGRLPGFSDILRVRDGTGRVVGAAPHVVRLNVELNRDLIPADGELFQSITSAGEVVHTVKSILDDKILSERVVGKVLRNPSSILPQSSVVPDLGRISNAADGSAAAKGLLAVEDAKPFQLDLSISVDEPRTIQAPSVLRTTSTATAKAAQLPDRVASHSGDTTVYQVLGNVEGETYFGVGTKDGRVYFPERSTSEAYFDQKADVTFRDPLFGVVKENEIGRQIHGLLRDGGDHLADVAAESVVKVRDATGHVVHAVPIVVDVTAEAMKQVAGDMVQVAEFTGEQLERQAREGAQFLGQRAARTAEELAEGARTVELNATGALDLRKLRETAIELSDVGAGAALTRTPSALHRRFEGNQLVHYLTDAAGNVIEGSQTVVGEIAADSAAKLASGADNLAESASGAFAVTLREGENMLHYVVDKASGEILQAHSDFFSTRARNELGATPGAGIGQTVFGGDFKEFLLDVKLFTDEDLLSVFDRFLRFAGHESQTVVDSSGHMIHYLVDKSGNLVEGSRRVVGTVADTVDVASFAEAAAIDRLGGVAAAAGATLMESAASAEQIAGRAALHGVNRTVSFTHHVLEDGGTVAHYLTDAAGRVVYGTEQLAEGVAEDLGGRWHLVLDSVGNATLVLKNAAGSVIAGTEKAAGFLQYEFSDIAAQGQLRLHDIVQATGERVQVLVDASGNVISSTGHWLHDFYNATIKDLAASMMTNARSALHGAQGLTEDIAGLLSNIVNGGIDLVRFVVGGTFSIIRAPADGLVWIISQSGELLASIWRGELLRPARRIYMVFRGRELELSGEASVTSKTTVGTPAQPVVGAVGTQRRATDTDAVVGAGSAGAASGANKRPSGPGIYGQLLQADRLETHEHQPFTRPDFRSTSQLHARSPELDDSRRDFAHRFSDAVDRALRSALASIRELFASLGLLVWNAALGCWELVKLPGKVLARGYDYVVTLLFTNGSTTALKGRPAPGGSVGSIEHLLTYEEADFRRPSTRLSRGFAAGLGERAYTVTIEVLRAPVTFTRYLLGSAQTALPDGATAAGDASRSGWSLFATPLLLVSLHDVYFRWLRDNPKNVLRADRHIWFLPELVRQLRNYFHFARMDTRGVPFRDAVRKALDDASREQGVRVTSLYVPLPAPMQHVVITEDPWNLDHAATKNGANWQWADMRHDLPSALLFDRGEYRDPQAAEQQHNLTGRFLDENVNDYMLDVFRTQADKLADALLTQAWEAAPAPRRTNFFSAIPREDVGGGRGPVVGDGKRGAASTMWRPVTSSTGYWGGSEYGTSQLDATENPPGKETKLVARNTNEDTLTLNFAVPAGNQREKSTASSRTAGSERDSFRITTTQKERFSEDSDYTFQPEGNASLYVPGYERTTQWFPRASRGTQRVSAATMVEGGLGLGAADASPNKSPAGRPSGLRMSGNASQPPVGAAGPSELDRDVLATPRWSPGPFFIAVYHDASDFLQALFRMLRDLVRALASWLAASERPRRSSLTNAGQEQGTGAVPLRLPSAVPDRAQSSLIDVFAAPLNRLSEVPVSVITIVGRITQGSFDSLFGPATQGSRSTQGSVDNMRMGDARVTVERYKQGADSGPRGAAQEMKTLYAAGGLPRRTAPSERDASQVDAADLNSELSHLAAVRGSSSRSPGARKAKPAPMSPRNRTPRTPRTPPPASKAPDMHAVRKTNSKQAVPGSGSSSAIANSGSGATIDNAHQGASSSSTGAGPRSGAQSEDGPRRVRVKAKVNVKVRHPSSSEPPPDRVRVRVKAKMVPKKAAGPSGASRGSNAVASSNANEEGSDGDNLFVHKRSTMGGSLRGSTAANKTEHSSSRAAGSSRAPSGLFTNTPGGPGPLFYGLEDEGVSSSSAASSTEVADPIDPEIIYPPRRSLPSFEPRRDSSFLFYTETDEISDDESEIEDEVTPNHLPAGLEMVFSSTSEAEESLMGGSTIISSACTTLAGATAPGEVDDLDDLTTILAPQSSPPAVPREVPVLAVPALLFYDEEKRSVASAKTGKGSAPSAEAKRRPGPEGERSSTQQQHQQSGRATEYVRASAPIATEYLMAVKRNTRALGGGAKNRAADEEPTAIGANVNEFLEGREDHLPPRRSHLGGRASRVTASDPPMNLSKTHFRPVPQNLDFEFHKYTLASMNEVALGQPLDIMHNTKANPHSLLYGWGGAREIVEDPIYLRHLWNSNTQLPGLIGDLRGYTLAVARRRAQEIGDGSKQTRKETQDFLTIFSLECPDAPLRLYVDACLTLLATEYDLAAHVLSHAIVEVYRHPHVLAKLRQEVDAESFDTDLRRLNLNPRASEYSDNTKNGDAQDLRHKTKASYLTDVILETIRLHPLPQCAPARVPFGADVLPDGTYMPAGTGNVLLYVASAANVAKDRWGNDARSFVPERWAYIQRPSRVEFASYVPRLTMSHVRVCLSTLVKKLDMHPVNSTGEANMGSDVMDLRCFVTERGKSLLSQNPVRITRNMMSGASVFSTDGEEIRYAHGIDRQGAQSNFGWGRPSSDAWGRPSEDDEVIATPKTTVAWLREQGTAFARACSFNVF